MVSRRTLYVGSFVAASLAYILVILAFTGEFSVVEWAVFAVVFLLVLFVSDRLIGVTDQLE